MIYYYANVIQLFEFSTDFTTSNPPNAESIFPKEFDECFYKIYSGLNSEWSIKDY